MGAEIPRKVRANREVPPDHADGTDKVDRVEADAPETTSAQDGAHHAAFDKFVLVCGPEIKMSAREDCDASRDAAAVGSEGGRPH